MLFGEVLPSSSTFSPRNPSLHSLPSVKVLGMYDESYRENAAVNTSAADSEQLSFNEARKFLIRYLVNCEVSNFFVGKLECTCSSHRKRFDLRHWFLDKEK